MAGEKRVVITRTPFRMSFAGGGTDIPDYYRNYGGGAVVSASINQYVYIIVAESFNENSIKMHYSKIENDVTNLDEIQHPSARECLRYLGITKGIEISTLADAPAKGTGLGSSSSFAVGLLNALYAYKGEKASPKDLAEKAIHIERNVLKEAGGKQDQYVAAYGGLLLMEFNKDDTTEVKRLQLSLKDREELQKHLMLMYIGKERSSSEIHKVQANSVGNNASSYKRMAELAYMQAKAFEEGRWQETGKLLHENWMLKKTLGEGISNAYIDRLYNTAIQNGAEGGKIIGAGGGGFFLFFAQPEKHGRIIEALPELRPLKFGFEDEGSKIIYEQGEPVTAK
ncbi:MAG: hypothetical protein QXF01_01765 [Candidatus Micrarchaeaceae archaeon]